MSWLCCCYRPATSGTERNKNEFCSPADPQEGAASTPETPSKAAEDAVTVVENIKEDALLSTPACGMLRTGAGEISSTVSTGVENTSRSTGSPSSVTQPPKAVVKASEPVESPALPANCLPVVSQMPPPGSPSVSDTGDTSSADEDSSSGTLTPTGKEGSASGSAPRRPVSLDRLRLNLSTISMDREDFPIMKTESSEEESPFKEIKNIMHLQDFRAQPTGNGRASKSAGTLPPMGRGKERNAQRPTRAVAARPQHKRTIVDTREWGSSVPQQGEMTDVEVDGCALFAPPQSQATEADMGDCASLAPPQGKKTEVEMGDRALVAPPQSKRTEADVGECVSSARDRFFTPRPWPVDNAEEAQHSARAVSEDMAFSSLPTPAEGELFYTPRVDNSLPSYAKASSPRGRQAAGTAIPEDEPLTARGELFYTPRVDLTEPGLAKPKGGMAALAAAASQAYFGSQGETASPGKDMSTNASRGTSPLSARKQAGKGRAKPGIPKPAGLSVFVAEELEMQENANHFSNPLFSPRLPPYPLNAAAREAT